MSYLTAAELASIRADNAAAMPDTCDVIGWLTVTNARGQVVDKTELARASGVACRLDRNPIPVFGAESGGAYGRTGEVIDTTALAFRLALPWGTEIRQSDHVRLASGAQFEVTSVDDVTSYGVEVVAGVVRLGIDNPEE